MTLEDFFTEHPKVAIAFSGGVDSAYLLYAALQYAKDVKAYYMKTAFQPEFELEDAKKLADMLQANMEILQKNILEDEVVASNPGNRCYFCKKQIFSGILEKASSDGYTEILDGTNASDDASDRPGMKALEELKVYSPLRICGLTKSEIRQRSKEAGLFTWDKPAYACLATRIPTGCQITEELLKKTERSEKYLSELGFYDFRVRYVDRMAKIQIREEQLELLLANRGRILEKLKADYQAVCLDLEVRNE